MQCKDVELVLEQEGLTPLPAAARAHLAGCSHCQGFVADLATIVSLAYEMPAEVAPPARVWQALRAQLEREGIISTPVVAAPGESSSWWHGFGELFRSRALAAAAVGLLIAAAAFVELRQPPVPSLEAPASVAAQPGWQIPFKQTAKVLNEQEVDLRNMQLASTSPSPVDQSYRQSLEQVDEFIAECERRVKTAPQDDLAREYLSNAYQQKAELLSAMMDREGSVH